MQAPETIKLNLPPHLVRRFYASFEEVQTPVNPPEKRIRRHKKRRKGKRVTMVVTVTVMGCLAIFLIIFFIVLISIFLT